MASGTVEIVGRNNAQMTWTDQNVANNTWATNTGNGGSGVCPSGVGWTGYNLKLDVAGKYLVTACALFATTSANGFRGIRMYKSENSIGEGFVAASGHNTFAQYSRIVESDGTNTVRMGLYQSSGATVSVRDIFITAIYLGE